MRSFIVPSTLSSSLRWKRWQRLEGFHSQHHFFRAHASVWNARQWKKNTRNNCNPSGLFLLLLKWLLLRKTAAKCATQSSCMSGCYATQNRSRYENYLTRGERFEIKLSNHLHASVIISSVRHSFSIEVEIILGKMSQPLTIFHHNYYRHHHHLDFFLTTLQKSKLSCIIVFSRSPLI